VIIINIEVKYFVLIVLILIGNGKKNIKERKNSNENFIIFEMILLLSYLQAFQKVRDCSSIHEHAGTSAKIQVNQFFIFQYNLRTF
jgi:hypothetical protein